MTWDIHVCSSRSHSYFTNTGKKDGTERRGLHHVARLRERVGVQMQVIAPIIHSAPNLNLSNEKRLKQENKVEMVHYYTLASPRLSGFDLRLSEREYLGWTAWSSIASSRAKPRKATNGAEMTMMMMTEGKQAYKSALQHASHHCSISLTWK